MRSESDASARPDAIPGHRRWLPRESSGRGCAPSRRWSSTLVDSMHEPAYPRRVDWVPCATGDFEVASYNHTVGMGEDVVNSGAVGAAL